MLGSENVAQVERTIWLKIGGDQTVELAPSKVPTFTATTIPILLEQSEAIGCDDNLNLSIELRNIVTTLDEQIERLENANDNKTKDIILAVLKGAFLAAVLAATVFAFIVLNSNPVGAIFTCAAVVAGVGSIITVGNALIEAIKMHAGTGAPAIIILAPFIPIFEVLANIYSLNSNIEQDTQKSNELLTSLSKFFTDLENMVKIRNGLVIQIEEYKQAIALMPSTMDGQQTIQSLKAKKETALRELEAAIIYFTKLTTTSKAS
jgi:hypothetical protein